MKIAPGELALTGRCQGPFGHRCPSDGKSEVIVFAQEHHFEGVDVTINLQAYEVCRYCAASLRRSG